MNDINNIGLNKKNTICNSENTGVESARPKSTKQITHAKINTSNYKVEVNCSSNLRNIKVNSNSNIIVKKKRNFSLEKLKNI